MMNFFLSRVDENKLTRAAKEVKDYESALKKGYELLKKRAIIKKRTYFRNSKKIRKK